MVEYDNKSEGEAKSEGEGEDEVTRDGIATECAEADDKGEGEGEDEDGSLDAGLTKNRTEFILRAKLVRSKSKSELT